MQKTFFAPRKIVQKFQKNFDRKRIRLITTLANMNIIDGKIIDTGLEKYKSHPLLGKNLGAAALETLSKNTSEHFIYDHSLNRKMNRGTLLATALCIKDFIERNFADQPRIGIALPSGIAGLAVNLACQMAGKSSVNVNFTMGREAASHCLAHAGIKSVISSRKVRERVEKRTPDYPWSDNFYDIADILKSIGKKGVAKKLLLVKLLPSCVLKKLFRIPEDGGDREASIIFTSGSEGLPKAAVLTHANLMTNCIQMLATNIVGDGGILHANLPLFHSFGQSIQVWFTCIFGIPQVAVQSPLEVAQNFEAIRKGGSTLMISTPTFLRSYYKKGNPEDVKTLREVIAGAEKTPDGFAELWESRFTNVKYRPGYGLTEASPVVSVNLADNLPDNGWRGYKTGSRGGSVGQLFGGMQACTINPDTGEMLPIGETGLLCLKGGNVFGGYLHMPELNKARFSNGWLNTGDLASLDSDGFIYIKGRLSRFSKIGGEMVPHAFMEERIAKLLGQEEAEVPTVAIGSRDDDNKGESLVLVTSLDIDFSALRKALADEGIANLWIPRTVKKVEKIPVLGNGKLDLATIQRIAKQ